MFRVGRSWTGLMCVEAEQSVSLQTTVPSLRSESTLTILETVHVGCQLTSTGRFQHEQKLVWTTTTNYV